MKQNPVRMVLKCENKISIVNISSFPLYTSFWEDDEWGWSVSNVLMLSLLFSDSLAKLPNARFNYIGYWTMLWSLKPDFELATVPQMLSTAYEVLTNSGWKDVCVFKCNFCSYISKWETLLFIANYSSTLLSLVIFMKYSNSSHFSWPYVFSPKI